MKKATGLTLKDFERLLDQFAPQKGAPFEASGVVGGTQARKGPIKKIALALDLTSDSVASAIRQKCDVLIAFHAPDALKDSLSWHRRIKARAKNKLTLYKAHLRLNFCRDGVNDMLARMCGFTAVPLTFTYEEEFTVKGGVYKLRGTHTLAQIVHKMRAIRAPQIRVYNQQNKTYKKILLSSGSGFKKEFFEAFHPDMIISGEVKHGVVYLAKEYGTTLVEVTHWASEDRPLQKIAQTLARHLRVPVLYISLPLEMKTYDR